MGQMCAWRRRLSRYMETNNKLPWFIEDPTRAIEAYATSEKWLALDIETSNLNKGDATNGDNFIVYGYFTSSFCGAGDFNSWEDVKAFEGKLREADFIVVHGGKFELKWFQRVGIDISRVLIYDTLLGEYVIAGNRKFNLDLDSISKRYGGDGKASLVSELIHNGVCPSTIPRQLLVDYCRQDVIETVRIFKQQRLALHKSGLLPVFFLRCITTPVLAEIESNGIFLDKEMVLDVYKEFIQEYSGVVKKLNVITGGINMASPQQVASFLYTALEFKEVTDRQGNPIRGKANKKFPTGQPLTDEPTMEKLVAKTPVQKVFLKYKGEGSKLRKKITAYMERYMYACGHDFQALSDKAKEYKGVKGSCLLHGTLNQSISQTHRLTSSNPNLQNIDRKLKKVVKSRYKGWKIRNADYKTLEFTVAGILSQDEQIRADLENKVDIHSFTAETLTDAGQRTDRQDAKKSTFKPLYGGFSGTKAEKEYYLAFREKYTQCYNTQMGWVYEVLKTKKLRTVTGLIFYFPDTEIQSSGYITNTSNIFNYPVQMFATADIAPTASCLLWHQMKVRGLNSFLINAVHDSVLVEENPDESVELGNLIENTLSKDVIGFLKKVIGFEINYPLTIEQSSNTHWDYTPEEAKACLIQSKA